MLPEILKMYNSLSISSAKLTQLPPKFPKLIKSPLESTAPIMEEPKSAKNKVLRYRYIHYRDIHSHLLSSYQPNVGIQPLGRLILRGRGHPVVLKRHRCLITAPSVVHFSFGTRNSIDFLPSILSYISNQRSPLALSKLNFQGLRRP